MIRISVKLRGFDTGRAELRRANARFSQVATESLIAFSDETIKKLQSEARGGKLPGLSDGGRDGLPLIDSGKYIDSFKTETSGPGQVDIVNEGDNDNMSNAALSEVLEYGTSTSRAIPHIRPLMNWVEKVAPKKVGDRIIRGLFGRN